MDRSDVDLSLVLSHLSRSAPLTNGNLKEALARITETAAAALDIDRVNVWLFEEDHSQINCIQSYQRNQEPTPLGEVLAACHYPTYFAAIEDLRAFSVVDALSDPRTIELTESYLKPQLVTTMLDAPIYLEGKLLGIVCHEHTGTPRSWTNEEKCFAASIADFISISFESDRRIRAEERASSLQERMIELQRLESLGQLAGGVAHDFNNLLVTILGNSGLALRSLDDAGKTTQCLSDIQGAAEQAADLCKQLMAFSGKGDLLPMPVNLSILVHEIVRLLKISISPKAQLRCEFGDDLPVIKADATQLRRVVLNLVTNASEALAEREGTITVRTGFDYFEKNDLEDYYHVELSQSGYYVYVEVSDSGSGMGAETRKRLFEPFYTTKPTGRGLGMAVVIGIIRSHQGAIRVVSEEHKGTTIRALFPVY